MGKRFHQDVRSLKALAGLSQQSSALPLVCYSPSRTGTAPFYICTIMSNPTIPPTPPSPGVGARRKGHKTLPRLPLTAFSPPNSGVSESFPLPPSPSTVHPDRVVDASVGSSLADWKREVSGALKGRIGGVVVKITQDQLAGYVIFRLSCLPVVGM